MDSMDSMERILFSHVESNPERLLSCTADPYGTGAVRDIFSRRAAMLRPQPELRQLRSTPTPRTRAAAAAASGSVCM
jgi:hypothetical protein